MLVVKIKFGRWMTINEWRDASNMPPLEGGDEPIRRLDASTVKEGELKQEGSEEENGTKG